MPFTTAAVVTTGLATSTTIGAGVVAPLTASTFALSSTAVAGASWGTAAMAGVKYAAGAFSAYSSYKSARAQGAYGSYQHNMYDLEADRLLQQRELVDIKSARDIYAFRKSYERNVRAPAFVKRIKQGVEPTTGTPVLVALANAREADEEIMWNRWNAGQKKRALEDKAALSRYAGDIAYQAGKSREKTGIRRAGMSLLAADVSAYQMF